MAHCGEKRRHFITSSFCLGVRAVRKPEVLALSALPPPYEALHSLHQSHRRWATQHEVGTLHLYCLLLSCSFPFVLLSLSLALAPALSHVRLVPCILALALAVVYFNLCSLHLVLYCSRASLFFYKLARLLASFLSSFSFALSFYALVLFHAPSLDHVLLLFTLLYYYIHNIFFLFILASHFYFLFYFISFY